jgi:hypothetical protein
MILIGGACDATDGNRGPRDRCGQGCLLLGTNCLDVCEAMSAGGESGRRHEQGDVVCLGSAPRTCHSASRVWPRAQPDPDAEGTTPSHALSPGTGTTCVAQACALNLPSSRSSSSSRDCETHSVRVVSIPVLFGLCFIPWGRAEVSQLIKVGHWTEEPRASVVFVHGLGGHPYDTWRSRGVSTPVRACAREAISGSP